ncbi:MAG: hypothetical protein ABJA02_13890 [Acidobacteriota bacterium]
MRSARPSFLILFGMILMLGFSSAFAADDSGKKQPKDSGTLSVRTTEASYPVKIDGVERGVTGVGTPAIYYLTPGFHKIEVLGPDGKIWANEIEIRRGQKNCVCLKIVRETTSRPCPYNFHLEGPDKIMEGDLVTFAAINSGTAPIPLKYAWKVDNGHVTNGLGTPTITVDSTGMAGRTINAVLDVNDDVYDSKCRQVISVPTDVGSLPPPIKPYTCDEFMAKSADDDKARFDNCAIQVQNTPDAQLYIIIYPGTDKLSTTRNTYDKLSKRTLDYLVKTRGVDPRSITIVKGSSAQRTTYQLWIVPPGAQPPVVK